MTNKFTTLGLLLTITLLICLLAWQYHSIQSAKHRPSFRTMDIPYIQKASQAWAVANTGDESVMKNRYPVVVHFPDKICVQLMLQTGSVGGSPIYCYERNNMSQVYAFDDLE